jgi:hypothetical protein
VGISISEVGWTGYSCIEESRSVLMRLKRPIRDCAFLTGTHPTDLIGG